LPQRAAAQQSSGADRANGRFVAGGCRLWRGGSPPAFGAIAREKRHCPVGKEGLMAQQEQWQLGGNAPEMYERYFVPTIFAPLASLLIELAAIQPSERVLDVACGTGVVARLAAQYVGPTGQV